MDSNPLDIWFWWLLSRVQYGKFPVCPYMFLGVPFNWIIFEVFEGIYKVVWGTWGLFMRDLILMIRLDFLDSLPLVIGLPRPLGRNWLAALLGSSFSCCYLLKKGSNCFGGTASRWRVTSWEVFFLPSCFVFIWQRMSWLDLLPSFRRPWFL